ncbi:DNA-binding protein, partial [Salmonella enterica subsp. enterica]|nr:DNA-binding protein [Salmonella enterica subsp. enterica]
MGILAREMTHLAKQAGGAHKTVSDRMAQARRFCDRLMAQNVQIRHVQHLKARHIEDYIRHRLAQGIDKRTLQNEMAMIRIVLRQAGRVKLADGDRISNRAVGIGGASRNGTRRAITDDKYQAVQENARLKDPGLA